MPLKTKPTDTSGYKRDNLIVQPKPTTSRITRSQTVPSSQPSTSSGLGTLSSTQKRQPTQPTGIPTRRNRLLGVSNADNLDKSYQPPAHYKKSTLNQSSIATRLRQRSCQGEKPKPFINTGENSSSEDASSEDSEDSSAPVYRKVHSVFPSLKPTLVPPKEVTPEKASSYLPSPWFPAQCSQPVEVYIDGACAYNHKGEPEGGVGVWFDPDHPWNISEPAQGRQTNNSAEIQAATAAAKKATENGVTRLSVFTDSKFLIDSCTKWMPTWEENGWKTADGKPVVNKTKFKELLKALAPLEVLWNHVPGHQGVEGNEAADQLAKAGIEKNKPTAMTSLEDGTFHKDPNDELQAPAENIIDISPNCTSSDNDSDDEELDIPGVVSDPPNEVTEVPNAFDIRAEVQKSVAEFDKSITEHQSYFWDQEGLDQADPNQHLQ